MRQLPPLWRTWLPWSGKSRVRRPQRQMSHLSAARRDKSPPRGGVFLPYALYGVTGADRKQPRKTPVPAKSADAKARGVSAPATGLSEYPAPAVICGVGLHRHFTRCCSALIRVTTCRRADAVPHRHSRRRRLGARRQPLRRCRQCRGPVGGFAEPGPICVSGTARDHIGTKIPIGFADLGKQQVKNMHSRSGLIESEVTLHRPLPRF